MGLNDMYRKYQQQRQASKGKIQTANIGNFETQLNKCISYFQNGEYEEAVKWLEPLANLKNPTALNYYGRMFRDGLYFSQDLCKAFSLFEQSAAQGNAEGQILLSGMYYRQQNYNKAFELCMQSADQGNLAAIRNAGVFYENGFGVDRNYHEALKWYNLAQQRGYISAENDINRVEDKLIHLCY